MESKKLVFFQNSIEKKTQYNEKNGGQEQIILLKKVRIMKTIQHK